MPSRSVTSSWPFFTVAPLERKKARRAREGALLRAPPPARSG